MNIYNALSLVCDQRVTPTCGYESEYNISIDYKGGTLTITQKLINAYHDSGNIECTYFERGLGSVLLFQASCEDYFPIFHEGPWVEYVKSLANIKVAECRQQADDWQRQQLLKWERNHKPVDI